MNTIRKALVSLALTALVAFATAGQLEAQTPEGTVIRNIASVTFTDANSNAYAAVADTIDVTVGFGAGMDVTGAASASPASGSTGNTLTYQIHNDGNGADSATVSSSSTLATITGYVYNATPYANLGLLNAALAAVSIASGDSIPVDVVYDIPGGSGGQSGDVTLTGTSRRDGAEFDTFATTINVGETIAVTVTAIVSPTVMVVANESNVPPSRREVAVTVTSPDCPPLPPGMS